MTAVKCGDILSCCVIAGDPAEQPDADVACEICGINQYEFYKMVRDDEV